MDILSHLSLPLLVAEEELIVPLISAIKEHPVTSRMISIFFNLYTGIDNADLRGSGDKKHGGLISRAFTVWVDIIDEGWYPGKVNDLVVFVKGT
jgi:hypothetical protein